MDKLEIQTMIEELENKDPRTKGESRQHEILLRLKILCHWSHTQMLAFGSNWKQKYYGMFKKNEWKEGRLLIKEYKTLENDNILICIECNQEIMDNQSFTLHHDMYGKPHNFLNPIYCEIIHTKCHHKGNPRDKRGNPKKWKEGL